MLKIIAILLVLNASVMTGQAAPPQPFSIGLTLIPPSPVTDQITLDIRAGIRNDAKTGLYVSILIYLDHEEKSKVLYKQELIIPANDAQGIRFGWPTQNQQGRHVFILVCKTSAKTFRVQKSVDVIASAARSTKRIDGAFMGFYHWSEKEGKYWNSEIKKMTDDQWKELIDAQHGLGMNIVVLQELFRNQKYAGEHEIEKEGYKGLAYYPSDIFPGRMPITAKDPVEAVLTEADKKHMNVFLGVGMYAWFDFTHGSLSWHKKIAAELWRKYRRHPSFYGWYISEEMDGGLGTPQQQQDIVDFFEGFTSFVRSLSPDKPVMLATNSHNIRNGLASYRKLLPNLDILCPFGFQRMPTGDYTGGEAAHTLQSLCDSAHSHLWMDLEVFDFEPPDNALVPRSIDGLLSDLHSFPNFEKIICYQFPGLLNSPDMSLKPGGEKTVKLYLDYKKYLTDLNRSEKISTE